MECSSQPLYARLRTKTSTRLLTLHPGSGRGPINASLRQVDLADDPEFEAISYTWGEDTIKKTVVINGQKILAWNNLWNFLKVLRHETRSRTLWVDAISICQTDTDEKAQQIGIIGKIFSYATRVVAWVGEHADGSEALFQPWPTLKPFPGIPAYKTRGFRGKIHKAFGQDEEHYRRQHEREQMQEQIRQRWPIWRAFARRNYFSRMWIVQEISVATKLFVYCGDDCMDWHDLITSRWRGGKVFDGLSVDQDELTILRQLDTTRIGYSKGPSERLDIFKLGEQFYDQSCTETRDRVFALLSLESRKPGDLEIAAKFYKLDLIHLAVLILGQRQQHVHDFRQLDTLFDMLNMDEAKEMEVLKLLKRKADAAGGEEYWKTLYHKRTRQEDRAVFEEVWNPQANLLPIYAPSALPRRGRRNHGVGLSNAVHAKVESLYIDD